jgi:hypothetical protein
MNIPTNEQASTESELSTLALNAPAVNALVTSLFINKTAGVSLDLPALVMELNRQINCLRDGDKSKAEETLFSQAVTLNAIFLEMSRRAAMNMNEHIHATETYMRMALRAQNQARATLETLAAMRSPPVVIAKQANITSGPQQVNNLQA